MNRKSSAHKLGQVRIIGGDLRSRLIQFPSIEDLRPTPNRIRETLFNWLAPHIRGARCLDLFAGSGALGFEAKSRGAKYCLLLDASREIIEALRQNKIQLGLSDIDVFQATFPFDPTITEQQFDIVFIDPPFHQNYVQLGLEWLQQHDKLTKQAVIYIESESEANVFELPSEWRMLKDKIAGRVRYSLITNS